MKCFYHNDLDGHCAGAIVRDYYRFDENDKTGETYVEMDYNKPFPLESVYPNEKIVIVDFSLSTMADWASLLSRTSDVVWIDHHISAIEQYQKLDLKGIQRTDLSGCELAWEFYYPDRPIPLVVKLLGDYDTWKFKHGNASRHLQLGITLYDTLPESAFWPLWFEDPERVQNMIEVGNTISKYRENQYRHVVNNHSFEVDFEGYRAIACNSHERRSQLFDSISKDYDLMMPFCFDGKNWVVSIYSVKDVDCSKLAKKHGGGGHRNAAGFVCEQLPFTPKIIWDTTGLKL